MSDAKAVSDAYLLMVGLKLLERGIIARGPDMSAVLRANEKHIEDFLNKGFAMPFDTLEARSAKMALVDEHLNFIVNETKKYLEQKYGSIQA